MQITGPKKEWNINTIISVLGFGITLVAISIGYGQFTERMEQATLDFSTYRTATDLRLSKLETDTRQIDNLAFRMAAAESSNATVTKVMADLQAAVAQQSGDIRVVREILTRLDRQSPTSFAPMAMK